MNIKLFLTFIFLITIEIYSQFGNDARLNGLSNSDFINSKGALSLFTNPASIFNSPNSFNIYNQPGLFTINELSTFSFAIKYKLINTDLALGISTFGFDLYKEHQINFAIADEIFKDFIIGISIIYKNISIHKYGSNHQILFSAGLIKNVLENFKTTLIIDNINIYNINNFLINSEINFKSSLSYSVVNNVSLFLSFEKQISSPFILNYGIELFPIEHIFIRAGFSDVNNNISGGFGFFYNNYMLNYSLAKHLYLGYSHSFDVNIAL